MSSSSLGCWQAAKGLKGVNSSIGLKLFNYYRLTFFVDDMNVILTIFDQHTLL